tara:strand:- start:334 stop:1113 length:780 start_codon:yes stop_codon:yes gene_type:complete
MAKNILRSPAETFLSLDNAEEGLFPLNHILEPEYHQEEYVQPCSVLEATPNSFQISKSDKLIGTIHRGMQPRYADVEEQPDTLYWMGMTKKDGNTVPVNTPDANICALKSVCIRYGFIDLDTARSVSPEFYKKNKAKAGVQKNDVLINSTGDGTIGRVAVFNYNFPAVVDGHVTILRFSDADYAWYIAAFLLSDSGQKQIYRYINGSSGQVEVYPQDIGRIWIKPSDNKAITSIARSLRDACVKHDEFQKEIKKSLSKL